MTLSLSPLLLYSKSTLLFSWLPPSGAFTSTMPVASIAGRFPPLLPAGRKIQRSTIEMLRLQSWALAHPNLQVLNFLGTQVSPLYSEFEHTSADWVRNWARKLNFLGLRPALRDKEAACQSKIDEL